LKLGPQADAREFVHYLSRWPGILSVTQTFPDESDQDLAKLLVLEIEPSAVASTLKKLRKNPSVEYAEEPAPRRLIR
jgi:hypothetical protein